jgi:hypothetical protein
MAVLIETAAGGSMGGHDPRQFGKIRYIVRAFGTWAGGKHHICVKRLQTEHPEVCRGNCAALCAWLKDQWAGTTKWRGRSSDPKQKAESLAIEKAAQARNAALRALEADIISPRHVDVLYTACRRHADMPDLDEVIREAAATMTVDGNLRLYLKQIDVMSEAEQLELLAAIDATFVE